MKAFSATFRSLNFILQRFLSSVSIRSRLEYNNNNMKERLEEK